MDSVRRPGKGESQLPAVWKSLQFRPDATGEPFDVTEPPGSPETCVRIEPTPAEFGHLLANLEHNIADSEGTTPSPALPLPGEGSRTVMGICSAVGGEGKTTVALHLALTLARNTNKRICLADLSLNDGGLSQRLGIGTSTGGIPAAAEAGDQSVMSLQIGGLDNLLIIPAGRRPTNAPKTARSAQLAQIVDAARQTFDIVIVDMPAVSSDNAVPISRLVDGVLMVTRAGATPADTVSQAIDVLGPNHVVGVVLNRTQSALPPWLERRLRGA